MNSQSTSSDLQYAVSDLQFVVPHFPQFDFCRLMAEGSMGASYKVIQKKLERKEALKVIARRLGRDQSFAKAFTQYAKASAQLSHPNLAQLYDFGETGEMLYMVSEYVSGTTLDKAANGAPIDPQQVVKIMLDIAKGMTHAHKHDLVHGDLQPATILVNSEIEAKVNDFGLAMSLRMLGHVQAAPLNPHYAAPEIFRGETHGDRLTDIYSLGAIMYFLLTSEGYEGGLVDVSSNSTCDERFDKVVAKALHPDRMQRYESVSEFLIDLENLQQAPQEEAPSKPSTPSAAAYITPLVAAQNQTVRVVKRPVPTGVLKEEVAKASPKFSFPLAG